MRYRKSTVQVLMPAIVLSFAMASASAAKVERDGSLRCTGAIDAFRSERSYFFEKDHPIYIVFNADRSGRVLTFMQVPEGEKWFGKAYWQRDKAGPPGMPWRVLASEGKRDDDMRYRMLWLVPDENAPANMQGNAAARALVFSSDVYWPQCVSAQQLRRWKALVK